MSTINSRTQASRTAMNCALVLFSVVLTTLVRLALTPLLGNKAALIMYFPALVFSAWVGGWAGGIAALALSTLTVTYFFLSPTHSLSVAGHAEQLTLLVFVVVGLSVSALSNSQRRAWQQAKESAAILRERGTSLRESEARKSAVLEVALDCIITADGQGNILEFNPAAERTFGYARTEVLGRPIADVIIPLSLRAAHSRGIERYHATGEGPILNQRIEVPALHADGTEFFVELAVVPITLEGRSLFTAYLRDLTERKRAEEELRLAAACQRAFLRDVLASVTEGHLILCHSPEDLPRPLSEFGEPITLSRSDGLRELRVRTRQAAESLGLSAERTHDLVTAAGESGMNAVVHVGEGIGQVFVSDLKDTVQVWVIDLGAGIALENLPHATLMKGYSSAGTMGHGMKMMLQTADRVFLLTGSTGTTLVIEQDRVAAALLA